MRADPPQPAAIEIADLHVALGGNTILAAIDLDVSPGEVIGVLGPNGSGKSTLLRCIGGALRPTRGCVRIDGREVRHLQPIALARLLAVHAQEVTAALGYSVREVVAMGRLAHRSWLAGDDARDAEIVERSMALLELGHLAERAIETLSGGERQRAMIARALAQQPRALVLDEPSNHLDLRHQFSVLDLVRGLGLTVIVTLHDLRLAARICDRIVLLHEGRIAAVGAPAVALTAEAITRVYRVGAAVAPRADSGELDVRLFPMSEELRAVSAPQGRSEGALAPARREARSAGMPR